MKQSVKIELASTDTKLLYAETGCLLPIPEVYERVAVMKKIFFDGVSPVRTSVEVREDAGCEED